MQTVIASETQYYIVRRIAVERIVHLRREGKRRPIQFKQSRRHESLRIGAAEQECVRRPPLCSKLRRGVAAEVAIMVIAACGCHGQSISRGGIRPVPDYRDPGLGK